MEESHLSNSRKQNLSKSIAYILLKEYIQLLLFLNFKINYILVKDLECTGINLKLFAEKNIFPSGYPYFSFFN